MLKDGVSIPENESLERSGAEEAADLQERLSCSFGLCGTHCILEGKAGGHCKNGICYCVQK